MKFLIPDTKKKTEFIFHLTASDILVVVIALVLLALVGSSTLVSWLKITLIITIFVLATFSVITIDVQKGWKVVVNFVNFLTRRKKWDNENITEQLQIKDSIHYEGGCWTSVIQLNGVDFSILSEESQDNKIFAFMEVLKELKNGKIIKMEELIDFKPFVASNDKYIALCQQKLEKQAEKKWGKDVSKWKSQEDEPEYLKKLILENQNSYLAKFDELSQTTKSAYYLIIQEESEQVLQTTTYDTIEQLSKIGLFKKQLKDKKSKKELTNFLKRFMTYKTDVKEEKEISFKPTIEKSSKVIIDDVAYRTICVHKYKMFNDNAWAWKLFAIPGVRVVINFRPYSGKSVERLLNQQFAELKMRLEDQKTRDYERNQLQGEFQTMQAMLTDLQFGTDKLFDVEFYLTYPVQLHKFVVRQVRSAGIVANDLFLEQYDGYLSTLPFARMDSKKKSNRINSIPSSALAGAFPFVIKELFDKNGSYLGGSNGLPVFADLFHRDEDRKNSNAVIFGTSGGGKSYFLKKMLLQYYTQGKRVFVLDPDNEYRRFNEVFNVDYVDLAGLKDQKINPLQVFPAFTDEGVAKNSNEVTAHLVFLEQFFQTVLPDLGSYQKDLLLNYISTLYRKSGIVDGIDVSVMNPNQFPTFSELMEVIISRQNELIANRKIEEEYELKNLSPLIMAMQKFTEGGIYSSLWNGHTTLTIHNDFTVFNFQSLFATGNNVVVNAQMLLVIKFLNQEVIKNREEAESNIVIAIDEAHRFIDGKFTVGLDFMEQEAKQIRKYYGSLIVATQNIDDFCGVSPEMKQKASAVINCCQYSFVFNLAPDDINRITELYKNYNGGLQKEEVNYIASARKGDCLMIASKDIRLPVHITTYPGEDYYFLDQKATLTA